MGSVMLKGTTSGTISDVDGNYSLSPDDFCLKAGITTVVDAGCSGWRNFPLFKTQVIDDSKTRILAFLILVAMSLKCEGLVVAR